MNILNGILELLFIPVWIALIVVGMHSGSALADFSIERGQGKRKKIRWIVRTITLVVSVITFTFPKNLILVSVEAFVIGLIAIYELKLFTDLAD